MVCKMFCNVKCALTRLSSKANFVFCTPYKDSHAKTKLKCYPKVNISEINSDTRQQRETDVIESIPPQNSSNPVTNPNEVFIF